MTESIVRLPLTKGYEAIIDQADFDLVGVHKWHVTFAREGQSKPYARRGGNMGNVPTQLLHRVLLGATKGQVIDHINGDTLDNRRSNLRLCDARGNACNKPPRSKLPYKGIWLDRRLTHRPWFAGVKVNGKKHHKGGFATPEEAARAYDELARVYHGEFAWLNFPK